MRTLHAWSYRGLSSLVPLAGTPFRIVEEEKREEGTLAWIKELEDERRVVWLLRQLSFIPIDCSLMPERTSLEEMIETPEWSLTGTICIAAHHQKYDSR